MIVAIVNTILYVHLLPIILGLLVKTYLLFYEFWCTSPVFLAGRTVVVTGGCAGLGYEIAKALASRGCKVIVADKAVSERQREEMVKLTHNPNIVFEYVDLGSFKSVREFADRIKKSEKKLDVLINNAGIAVSDVTRTEDDLHLVMQVNYHSPILLTHLLVGLLKKSESGGRVLFTTSLLSYIPFMSAEEALKPAPGFKAFFYCKSKYLQIVTSDKLAEKLKPHNITCNAWHPLVVYTNIFQASKPYYANIHNNLILWFLLLMSFIAKRPVAGAQTGIYLACADEVKHTTGEFFGEGTPSRKPRYTKEFQEKVWKYTEQACKLRPEEKL